MKKKDLVPMLLAILILAVFFLLNIYNIYQKDYFVDEVISFKIANDLSLFKIVRGVDVHPIIFPLFTKIFPHHSIFILRIYSLMIMTTALILLYAFAKEHFKSRYIAIGVLILASFSVTIAEYATQARMYSLLFLLSTLILCFFYEKKYNLALTFMIIALFTHYYAIFLVVPFIITLYVQEERKTFWKLFYKTLVVYIIALMILSPVIYNQFFSDNNPYKLPPPHDRLTLISLPSMLIFPLVTPDAITTKAMFVISFAIIFSLVYLFITSSNKKDLYLKMSFITSIFIFMIAFIFNIPYHHRYIMIFFPMIYMLFIKTLLEKSKFIITTITVLYIVFTIMTLSSYHAFPQNQFLELSKTIDCPKNVLHETPFSYLPMSIYNKDCFHYIAKHTDWVELTHVTLYTTPDRVNNYEVSYDIYLHYFDEYMVPHILNNTNTSKLRIVKIE